MESVLKSLSIGLLLRWLLTGILGLISFRIGTKHPSIDALFKLHLKPDDLGVALIIGVTVYGVHRSVLYPWIEWFLDSEFASRRRERCPLISKRSCAALRTRWNRAADKESPHSGVVKHTGGWADWAHMQYSSTWCIIAGAIGARFNSEANAEPSVPLIVLGILLFISGLVSDWRLHSVEEYLESRNYREEKNPPPSNWLQCALVMLSFLLGVIGFIRVVLFPPESPALVAILTLAAFAFAVLTFRARSRRPIGHKTPSKSSTESET